MIISASRRTDLPAAHALWLENRFREGFVLVRNPMNPRRVSRVPLSPETVDGVVFWTKDPAPMLGRLEIFRPYPYYFQYTLTAYGRDAEANLPDHCARVETFLRLADRIGPERVLWRYDPILISLRYSPEWHLKAFSRLAERLTGATRRVTISFVDTYARNRRRLASMGSETIGESDMRRMAAELAKIARSCGMQIVACAEAADLSDCGVARSSCIDAELLGRIGGVPLKAGRDPGQRAACGCAPSIDIGAYNTCPNGCLYCYANYSPALLRANLARRDDASPLLCDRLGEGDCVSDRACRSLRDVQLRMEL